MAHGLYNCSVERIVAKLDSNSKRTRVNGIANNRIFINNEEVSAFDYRNGILLVLTKELKLQLYSQNEKLNLLISN